MGYWPNGSGQVTAHNAHSSMIHLSSTSQFTDSTMVVSILAVRLVALNHAERVVVLERACSQRKFAFHLTYRKPLTPCEYFLSPSGSPAPSMCRGLNRAWATQNTSTHSRRSSCPSRWNSRQNWSSVEYSCDLFSPPPTPSFFPKWPSWANKFRTMLTFMFHVSVRAKSQQDSMPLMGTSLGNAMSPLQAMRT